MFNKFISRERYVILFWYPKISIFFYIFDESAEYGIRCHIWDAVYTILRTLWLKSINDTPHIIFFFFSQAVIIFKQLDPRILQEENGSTTYFLVKKEHLNIIKKLYQQKSDSYLDTFPYRVRLGHVGPYAKFFKLSTGWFY